MTIKTLDRPSDINELYNGEIFVKASTLNSFNSIKSFIDSNNLICFIESENKIYAQGHEYTGITSDQIAALAKITDIESSIQNITEKLTLTNDNKSIIGALTYNVVDDQGITQEVQAPNVTSFVNTVVAAAQAGTYDIAQQLNNALTDINNINTLLEGFPVNNEGNEENVKEYVDRQLTNIVNQLALAIALNATIVIGDGNHINVSYLETIDQTDPDTGEVTYKPPYVFKVEGNDIASAQTLNNLITQVNSIFGDNNKTIKEIIDDELAAQLVPENAQEALDTLQEISNWIQSHPNDASAMNTAITNLTNEWNNSKDNFALKGDLYELDNEGNEVKKRTQNGYEYGTTLEEINQIIGLLSIAKDVEDGAEQNVINAINVSDQSIKLKDNTVEFDDGNDGITNLIKFLDASYDSTNRTIELGINTDVFERLNNLIVDTAVTNAVSEAKSYTDQKLSWIIT